MTYPCILTYPVSGKKLNLFLTNRVRVDVTRVWGVKPLAKFSIPLDRAF